jgi:hypothetical protein
MSAATRNRALAANRFALLASTKRDDVGPVGLLTIGDLLQDATAQPLGPEGDLNRPRG